MSTATVGSSSSNSTRWALIAAARTSPSKAGRVDRAARGAHEQRPRRQEVGLDVDRRSHDAVGDRRAHLRVADRLDRAVGEAAPRPAARRAGRGGSRRRPARGRRARRIDRRPLGGPMASGPHPRHTLRRRPLPTLRLRGHGGTSRSAARVRLGLDGRAGAVALVFGVLYLVLEPRPGDLAVHVFRAELFGREGFTIWNGHWYGGHHTPAYSVLSGPLSWLLGPRLVLVMSCVACAALFEQLARGHFGAERARCGRALARRRHGHAARHQPAAVRARYGVRARRPPSRSSAGDRGPRRGSPSSARWRARWPGSSPPWPGWRTPSRARGAAAPGWRWRRPDCCRRPPCPSPSRRAAGRPSRSRAYLPIPLFCAACLIVLPREERALRAGAVLYALGATLAVAVETPMGGTAVAARDAVRRPAAAVRVLGSPAPRRRRPCSRWPSPASALLAYWQWTSAIRDIDKALRDPAAELGLLRAAARVPRHAARPPPHRDPVHDAAAGRTPRWRRSCRWRAAGSASSTPAATRLLPRRPEPADLRELAGRERGALRGAAEREARPQLVRRAGADRGRVRTCAALALESGACTRCCPPRW